MRPTTAQSLILWLAIVVTLGCHAQERAARFFRSEPSPPFATVATSIEYPDVMVPSESQVLGTPRPLTIASGEPPRYRNITLEESVQLAIANSQVMRDLGGALLRAPQAMPTIYGPAAQESDPRFGVEAALAAFDAEFSTSAFFEKNDRALNNQFFGGGTRLLHQDAQVYQMQLAKRTATGTELILRHNTDYDANNAPANMFPSAWNTNFETEFRHPLLAGAGLEFNRIAGPGGVPGAPNGVLIARVNTDLSLADFEQGVVNLVSNVENAYWDLYFAYRDLDAKIAARNTALETWRRVQALNMSGRRGGEAEKEAHAREQYFRFEEEVQNALTGQLLEGTHTYNGSSGGTFRANSGVHTTERRLRLLIGEAPSAGELLRPAEEPQVANVVFDWDQAVAESLARRVELRRQRWMVKRRELEMIASRNYLLPQLDTVGRYRWRGFGKDLIGYGNNVGGEFDNAWQNLLDGNFQEWQLGVELSVPLGYRRGHATVRNAEILLARERSLLREQERQIIHDLSNALADRDRAYAVLQTTFNRRLAAQQELEATQAAFDADKASLDLLLEAQRRLADAENRYFRAVVEHALAIKNLHYEKGSLLDYSQVYLAEGPWPTKAYRDAAERTRFLASPGALSYILPQSLLVTAPSVAVLPQNVPPMAEGTGPSSNAVPSYSPGPPYSPEPSPLRGPGVTSMPGVTGVPGVMPTPASGPATPTLRFSAPPPPPGPAALPGF